MLYGCTQTAQHWTTQNKEGMPSPGESTPRLAIILCAVPQRWNALHIFMLGEREAAHGPRVAGSPPAARPSASAAAGGSSEVTVGSADVVGAAEHAGDAPGWATTVAAESRPEERQGGERSAAMEVEAEDEEAAEEMGEAVEDDSRTLVVGGRRARIWRHFWKVCCLGLACALCSLTHCTDCSSAYPRSPSSQRISRRL